MKTFSQAGQDLFVLKSLKNKRDGFFIDVGCYEAELINNTILLEKDFNWNGISIDIRFFDYSNRKCKFVNKNALEIDYISLFKESGVPEIIDYLSLDTDASSAECLIKLPFQKYSFRVLTIEHDFYRFGDTLRKTQRNFLFEMGYEIVYPDVCCVSGEPFEDWWINPKHV